MSATDPTAASYNALPYDARSLPQAHPDVLAMAATLHGLKPAAVEKCRVLELGCANGSNLLPMAEALPDSRFLGLDLSARQIADGQASIAELGLKNIELREADLLTCELGDQTFDYIICHGVYSWVPQAVQERILALCARHLSPQGIAYISYNVYPGFHKRQQFREMMQYHTASIRDPEQAAGQARALLEFLLKNSPDENGTYARQLRDELEKLRALPLSYLYHEHLEPHNNPCYFHEFMARASSHGLQFLAEAEGKGGFELLPEAAQKALSGLRHDIVRREQYIDFLRNSSLRSTLLCRRELTVERELVPAQVRDFQVLCAARPELPENQESIDLRSSEPLQFRTRLGSATVEHPVFKAALLWLHELRPLPLSVRELWEKLAQMTDEFSFEDTCELVLDGYRLGLVGLRLRRPQLAAAISETPAATPLTRRQARHAMNVTNQWHEAIATDPVERQILQRLDGTQNKAALIAALIAVVKNGGLKDQPGQPDAATVEEWMPSLIDHVLEHFHTVGLLAS